MKPGLFFPAVLLFSCFSVSVSAQSQSIIGKWQLVKQSDCMEENLSAVDGDTQYLVDEMKAKSSPTPQVVTFKEKLQGEESTRILNKKRSANNKAFLYKFNGETLLILDKKSQTITDNFMVEKFSGDSLIISNASRPCETKIFLRLK